MWQLKIRSLDTRTVTTCRNLTVILFASNRFLLLIQLLRLPSYNCSKKQRLIVPSAIALSAYISVHESQPALAKDAVSTPAKVDLKLVKDAIVTMIDKDAELRADGTALYGTMIRLAWHAAGTYSCIDKNGGSNGALQRFEPECSWGANAGLGLARDKLEAIKQQFPELSYADLYTYAGIVAVEATGGPAIPFRLGRTDASDGSTSPPDGRLPDADKGSFASTAQHIRDIFYRMGFTDPEIVALLGAHAVGRCHTDRSGYWGPWTNAETTFSNEYYRLLLEERWSPKLSHNGTAWSGPDQYEDKTGALMMLPSDLALITDPAFRKLVEIYAKDEDRFFKDFSSAFSKLLELGVPFPATKAWYQFW